MDQGLAPVETVTGVAQAQVMGNPQRRKIPLASFSSITYGHSSSC